MKVVINAQYGGFRLSAQALYELAQKQGKPCYFFKRRDNHGLDGPYLPLTIEECGEQVLGMFSAFTCPNPDAVLPDQSIKTWVEQSKEERRKSNDLYASFCIENWEKKRDDPLLVEVVERLGERASGRFSNLVVVEIPDGVEYQIEEYDGFEHVAEKHRTWHK